MKPDPFPTPRGALSPDGVSGAKAPTAAVPKEPKRDDRAVVFCEDCGAFDVPVTAKEIAAAYAHWRNHDYLYGCSHGN